LRFQSNFKIRLLQIFDLGAFGRLQHELIVGQRLVCHNIVDGKNNLNLFQRTLDDDLDGYLLEPKVLYSR